MIDKLTQAWGRSPLATVDPQMAALIRREESRQETTLDLIASQSIVSRAVAEAENSVLRHKYAEGYPGKRYYAGCGNYDEIEQLTIDRAKALFGADHANVQLLSGVPANTAVYLAALKLGDPVMGMDLSQGGHLSHGSKVALSGKNYTFHSYGVRPDNGLIDYDAVQRMAGEVKPKMIVCGASAYPRKIDFSRFREIADSVGAVLLADISHIAGLVAAGVHPSPVHAGADFVTTTTHKTLLGPRSAIILSKKEHADTIDKAVFPGTQGGAHFNTVAAVGVAFLEAQGAAFKDCMQQIVTNARILAETLLGAGATLKTGGTDNHLMLVDVNTSFGISGKTAQDALETAGIVANRNTIQGDKSPFKPTGIRLGTPTVTARGMGDPEMRRIGGWVLEVLRNPNDRVLQGRIRSEVEILCRAFPLMDRYVTRGTYP